MTETNWLKRQLELVEKEAETWPEWRKQEARTRFESCTFPPLEAAKTVSSQTIKTKPEQTS